MKKNVFKTTAMFRCVVTLRNGAHKIVRMTVDVMAKLTYAFRRKQSDPWLTERYEDVFRQFELLPSQVVKLLFINEYTGERLEIA